MTNSQVHIGNVNFLSKKEKENQKRYEEASREIDLDSEIKKIETYDLKYLFRYPNLGVLLATHIDKTYSGNEKKKVILDTVKSNLRYIDFDKLLLSILQVEFDKYEGDFYRFSYEEVEQLKSLSDKIGNLLSNKNIEINSDRFLDGISYRKLRSGIEQLNNSYVAGEFYEQDELNNLAKDYVLGIRPVEDLTPHEFKNVLKFTDGEIAQMLKKFPELLDYLIRNNIIEDSEKEDKDRRLFELIEKQEKIPDIQLQILFDTNKLTSEYLLQLYMDKNKVDIEEIKSLKDYVPEEFFEGMVNTSELVKLYLDEENQKERFDKYRKLFKAIQIDGKSLEEKNEISEQILDENIELLKEDSLIELYNLGIITIDTIIDYTGGNTLKQLYLSNALKPLDARRLFYAGIITEDMLKTIMQDKNIDESKKITLLYTTFPEIEDTEIMQNLEVYLREVEGNVNTKHNPDRKRIDKIENTSKETSEEQLKSLKKAYEPRAKYRLLSIIDEEYNFTYNEKDGTAIFFFPNKDEYVIEKLYDKDRKPSTGVATYILSKETYEENKDKFYQDGRINISALYSLKTSKTKGVKRYIHTGWANSMVKHYDLDNPNKYSREQILESQRLAKQVEESKKEIER